MTATKDDAPDATDPRDVELARLQAILDDLPVNVDATAEPEDGDDNNDRIELVRTGLVRVWFGGKRYRLRRPFFGEFRKIRTSLQDANDEIAEATDDALKVSREITDSAKDRNTDEMTPDAWVEWRKENRAKANTVNRQMADTAEDLRLSWWESTWDLLTLDGRPEDWPSWITDPNLANAVVSHWRSSPLGRG